MNLEGCKFDFTTDTINIFMFLKDKSGSMESYESTMEMALSDFKKDFATFEDKGSVAISNSSFDEYIDLKKFLSIEEFSTSYSANGGTHIYNSIVAAADYTIEYYKEIIKRTNTTPRVTFFVFTDGEDNDYNNNSKIKNATNAINKLKEIGATCVFVAFGNAAERQDGERLGFECTRKIKEKNELRRLMGKELSKSCKEQSKSAYSLGANFFSKAVEDEKLNSVEEQAINDDDFFNF